MARPIAGDPPASTPAPYHTPPNGLPAPTGPSPFNYTNQPTLPAPAVASSPTPLGLLNAFRRRWVLSTFVGALVTAAVVVGVWMAMPAGKHQARALVQLQPRRVEIVGKGQEFDAYRRHQIFLLKAPDLITRVVADPAVASLETIKESDEPISMIENALRVSVAAPEILEVTLTGNNIDDLRTILDKLVKGYVDDATTLDRKTRDDEIAGLDKTRLAVQAEIELQEKAIDLAARSAGTPGVDGTNNTLGVLHQRRANADGLVSTTAHEIDLLESEREVLVAQLADKTPRPPQDQEFVKQFVAGSPRVVEAKRKLKVAEEFLKSEEDKATDPDKDEGILKLRADVQKLRAETDAVEKTVGAEAEAQGRVVERVKKGQRVAELNTLIDVAKKKRDRFLQERDALAKVIGSTAGGAVNVDAMKKALQPQRDMADKVQTQLIQLRIDAGQERRASQRGAVDVIPNNNRNKKLALSAVSGIGCFFAVVLLVSFLEWRTRRVDGVDQVVNELGMRVIGTVPAFPNRASLQAATEAGGGNWRFVLNESINSTRTMLLHTARAQSMQVVMVTSATQGEGKTSLASQLATSMATAGMRTLLVDCDLRNPSVMKLFELPLTPGVSEVLRQEVDASEAVQATAVPNLWVIPAGQCSNATIAALAQGHPLETLFNRLRGQFDFVIVDSCPVLPVADALLIGQHVDGVVFSIMQDISQLPKVITASEKLTQLNVPLVGAVVNGIKQDIYSYGYNYVKQLPA